MSLDDITEDEFLPSCCENPMIELIFENNYLIHRCNTCGSARPELD